MKRPASAASSKAAPQKAAASSKPEGPAWATGIQDEKEKEQEGEEEEAKVEDSVADIEGIDPFETDKRKKDRSKDFKFKQLLSQGSLPPWVVKAWNDSKLKVGRVAKQREIVNQDLDRTSEGTMVLNLDKPVLSHIKDLCAVLKKICT